ncbi:MAG: GEVED domain-containing protein, partial [Lentimicrobium sp.]|nr:GEVED domain-containing protein [Lentimicrobium sp.]
MSKSYSYCLFKGLLFIGFLIAGSFQITVKAANDPLSGNVIKGERPAINISTIPDQAFEQGIIRIKFSKAMENQLDNAVISTSPDGIARFGIAAIDQLNQQYGVIQVKKTFDVVLQNTQFNDRHRLWEFHLWYDLIIPAGTNIRSMIMAYSAQAEIQFSEPVYRKEQIGADSDPLRLLSPPDGGAGQNYAPNDPRFNEQWHYHNTGQQGGTVDADIDLPEAWDIIRGNSSVIVAVEDGGIDYTHVDLAANMWSGIGYNFVTNSTVVTPDDHGTHVAGTVAANTNNAVGVSGVAGGSGSGDGIRLMSCQVFTSSSSGGFQNAPIWAADNGAAISQNSWGYSSMGVYDQVVLDAIDYFNVNGGGTVLNGGISIYSAGNTNSTGLKYPACYSGAFSVAATNNQDVRSWYSTWGSWVDIAAPGGETNTITERGVLSTLPGNTYGFYQGTSMACPHVSGVAALIVSLAPGLLTAQNVKDILTSTTDDISALNPSYAGMLGSGRLNAYQALVETQTYLPLTADFSVSKAAVCVGETTTFTDLSTNSPISWTWSFSPNNVVFDGGTNANSQNPQVHFTAPGTYTVALSASNAFSTDSEVKTNYILVSALCYCTPTYISGSGDGDYISLVQLGTINNSTDASASPFYTYYHNLSTDLNRNSVYTITLSSGTYPNSNYIAVWIDFNQNGIFETSEKLGNVDIPSTPATGTITFTVPEDALMGPTRMRVRESFGNTNIDPCIALDFGETEDYNVNITLPYCAPTTLEGSTDGDYISLVQLGSINNASGPSASPYFTYFRDLTTDLSRSSVNIITLSAGTYSVNNYISVWIDYNQNGIFDANEKLGVVYPGASPETATITFTVPPGALLGTTRMRVREVYNGFDIDPCSTYDYGETEDYHVNITPVVYCTPSYSNGSYYGDYISLVQLGSINNSTGPAPDPFYTYYSSLSTDLTTSSVYTITLSPGTYSDGNRISAWIDYNQDGEFDEGERLGVVDIPASPATGAITFTVPANALSGSTRLRVREVYTSGDANPDPCELANFGETEDYNVNILPVSYCIPAYQYGSVDGDFISLVQLESINNATGASASPYYTYYSDLTTDLNAGSQYTVTLSAGTYESNNNNISVWIDYNYNGVFEANEKLGNVVLAAAPATGTITFTVPQTAFQGTTRMRVREVFGVDVLDPCSQQYYGETEDYNVNIINTNKLLNLSVFLEGLYSGSGTMNQAHNGTGPQFGAGIADQISVELHQGADYGVIDYTVSDLNLGTNGSVIAVIPDIYIGNYYITIRHRSSLETTTALPVSFASGTINYSFDAPSRAYGDNLLLMIDGRYVIYSGDVNQDGTIDISDMSPVDNDASNFVAGYVTTDVNGDGVVDIGDMT